MLGRRRGGPAPHHTLQASLQPDGGPADATITAIEPQKNRPKRRSIFIDGQFALGVDQEVVQSLGLAVGQRIGAEELARVAAAEAHRQAKEQAYLLLSYRQRSRDEIRRKLSGKGFDEATIASVLLSLSDEGLVDDSAFADAWIRSRQTSKPTGKRLLKWELRQKGVEPELVEDALQKLEPDEEYAAALRSARRRLQRIAATDRNAARQRLVGFLQRRGFDWDITRRVLNTLAAEGHWDAVDSE